jgi:tetratricopeptide (TPR) repeat protein
MGRLDESIVQYTEAIRLNPKDGAAHINLAKNLRDKGRLDEAVDHVLKAGQVDPKLAIHQDKFGDELYSTACARIQQVGDAEAPANPDQRKGAN